MSGLREAVIAQFRRPTGALGRLAGLSMASRPSNRKRNRWTLGLLDIQATDHIFELGCGPGYALALAVKQARKGFVLGADHSDVMAAMARRRLARAIRKGRAEIAIGDDSRLDGYRDRFNVIYSANVIQFIEDKPRFFRRAQYALKPGGRMATTYQPRGRRPSRAQAEALAEECRRYMEAAGFRALAVEMLEMRQAPAVCILGVK